MIANGLVPHLIWDRKRLLTKAMRKENTHG